MSLAWFGRVSEVQRGTGVLVAKYGFLGGKYEPCHELPQSGGAYLCG